MPAFLAGAAPPGIQSIGPLPGDKSSEFVAFSTDGAALIARSTAFLTGATTDLLWTPLDGVRLAPAGLKNLRGVSAGGRFVTGAFNSMPARWDSLTGDILQLPAEIGSAVNISGDGSTITGFGSFTLTHWKEGGGVSSVGWSQFIQSPNLGPVSFDGSVAAASIGSYVGKSSSSRGFYWNGEGATTTLQGSAIPSAVTPDGSFIYGVESRSNPNGGTRNLARWRPDGSKEILILGTVDGTFSAPVGVDSAGSMLAMNRGFVGDPPSVWRPGSGYQSLRDLFTNSGIDLTGWKLSDVRAMSSDGLSFAGNGINPTGRTVAWVATIPSPPGLGMLGAGALLALRRRR